jgi:hypothetical protein
MKWWHEKTLMEKMMDDYDFVIRMFKHLQNKPEHFKSMERCIWLFMDKYPTGLMNWEMGNLKIELSIRMTQHFNQLKSKTCQ